mmetsp:Transcript_23120/g.17534  ORF Transcript_23120/g.17534 Transcript_23120/m.17534 type:complete len:101 (+) Transcript_23120:1712-2014(+)
MQKQKSELMEEIREVQDVQFKDFLKKVGVKKLEEYEDQWAKGTARDGAERRIMLEQAVSKMEKEVKALEENSVSQNVVALDSSLKSEEEKLQALLSGEKH